MSNEDEKKAGLVPSQSVALSCAGATSLVRRGVQDLVAKAEAEQWYKQGLALWHQQQYGQAVEYFRCGLQLDPNHAALQFYFGLAYYQGDGAPKQDYTQAAIWWRKAAEQGDPDAQTALGWLYHSGKGVSKDDAEAVIWWRKATEQGHAAAAHNLGMAFWFGKTESLAWLDFSRGMYPETVSRLPIGFAPLGEYFQREKNEDWIWKDGKIGEAQGMEQASAEGDSTKTSTPKSTNSSPTDHRDGEQTSAPAKGAITDTPPPAAFVKGPDVVHTFTNPKTGAKEQWKLVDGKAQKMDSSPMGNWENPNTPQSRADHLRAYWANATANLRKKLKASQAPNSNTPAQMPAAPSSTSTPSTDRRKHR